MASTSNPVHEKDKGKAPRSHFQPTVCLADWWLVKVEHDFQGSRLGVAGFTSREKQAMRAFSSAPILKRYGFSTLETTDGICVILDSLINKVRTLENGFSSDVCNHFNCGFPIYWKEYDEIFLREESPSSGVKLLKKSKKAKFLPDPLPQKSDSEISGSVENINMTCIASRLLQKKSYSAGRIVEEHIASDIPLTCVKNAMQSVTDSFSGRDVKISAVNDKNDDFQSPDNGGILSACHLYNRSRSKPTANNLRNVKVHSKDSTNANPGKSLSLSEEILTHTEGRVTTRSMSNLKMKEKNYKASARISGVEKISLNSVSSTGSGKVDLAPGYCEPGGRSNIYSEVSGLHGHKDQAKLGKLDAGSIKDVLEQISETSSQDKDLRKIKTNGKSQKAKNKATTSPSMLAAADNKKENVIAENKRLAEMNNSSGMKTRRKLRTPDKEKEKVPSASPQSLSCNRSRSGRLLMPTLAFWCNQRAIYDADRTITGIVDGINMEQPRKGSRSTPRKRRQLM
ncbi:uncharacterized protein LOC105164020 [Sesamum indicum]|uniref:Uncharacterized protein LOC105164020 n=1 Tax=Sesamum indicum TaxID=4182 RepID=A0A6I9T996_SESIN|nr:uncharacterized protein LOC105164020 [Sesamum indicum]